jgi:SpoVK/Ycf46/Vps4 family AAA+-type ATPase
MTNTVDECIEPNLNGPRVAAKSMAVEVIASDLGLDLFRIDLSSVVGKDIGETERNFDRIFADSVSANAVLQVDEAGRVVRKRSEVRDSHDRCTNM